KNTLSKRFYLKSAKIMCLNTHLFDCVYILKVIFMGYTVRTFVSNLHKEGSCFNRYGKWFAFALPLGGLFDVLENIVSFFLTANPGFFSYWLVFTDSTLAVIKFVFLEIAVIWLVLSIIALVGSYLYRKLFNPAKTSAQLEAG